MTNITASLVKSLREKTGAGMMECKKALLENNADISAATDWLRAKGLAKAAKKSSRVASEGLVSFVVNKNKASILEINTETDFVARNESFQAFVKEMTELSLNNDGDKVLDAKMKNGNTVSEEITKNIATIGENMSFRRSKNIEISNGVIGSYVHGALVSGMGKIGVLVSVECGVESEKVNEFAKHLAMHIAASSPKFVSVNDVDQAFVEHEKEIIQKQIKESNSKAPANIVEKMIEGKLKKALKEIVLLEQPFVVDGKTAINDVLKDLEKEIGSSVKIKEFVKFTLGEGIEKKEENFAEEVAKTISG